MTLFDVCSEAVPPLDPQKVGSMGLIQLTLRVSLVLWCCALCPFGFGYHSICEEEA